VSGVGYALSIQEARWRLQPRESRHGRGCSGAGRQESSAASSRSTPCERSQAAAPRASVPKVTATDSRVIRLSAVVSQRIVMFLSFHVGLNKRMPSPAAGEAIATRVPFNREFALLRARSASTDLADSFCSQRQAVPPAAARFSAGGRVSGEVPVWQSMLQQFLPVFVASKDLAQWFLMSLWKGPQWDLADASAPDAVRNPIRQRQLENFLTP
jgi:hypothetical protein